MKVIYKKLPFKRIKCLATIGSFDGVHIGHRYILQKLKEESRKHKLPSLVITFDILPKQFLSKNSLYGKNKFRSYFPGYLSDRSQRIALIKNLDIDYIWFLQTNRSLLGLSSEKFIKHICRYFNIKEIIVGEYFHFGHKGEGKLSCLRELSLKYNFEVLTVRKKMKNKKIVSSSFIRKLVVRGDIKEANSLLGHEFSLKGKVSRGNGLGARMSFPTANIFTVGYAVPPKGVYAAYVVLGKKIYVAAVNIGVSPTVFKAKKMVIEAHILNFNKDILGRVIKVVFLEKVRNERKFLTLNKLILNIQKDINYITAKYSTSPLNRIQPLVL